MGPVLTEHPATPGKTSDPWLPAAVILPTFLVAFATLLLMCDGTRVAPVWPANAVMLALLLQTPVEVWGQGLSAGACGLILASLIDGCLSVTSAVLTADNLLEVLFCAGLLRAWAGRDLDLRRPKHLLMFLLAAGLTAPLVSAVCAGGFLAVVRGRPFAGVATAWYVGDALGLVIATPLLLLASQRLRRMWLA